MKKLVLGSNLRVTTNGPWWNEYQYMVPASHSLDDVLNDYYFARSSLKENDRISFLDESKSIAGILVVTGRTAEVVNVSLVSGGDLDGSYEGPEKTGIFIVDLNPHSRFRVLDGETRAVLSENHQDKDIALDWAKDHATKRAA